VLLFGSDIGLRRHIVFIARIWRLAKMAALFRRCRPPYYIVADNWPDNSAEHSDFAIVDNIRPSRHLANRRRRLVDSICAVFVSGHVYEKR